ncbi:MAG: hypothetical protein Q7P63_06655 [Verrucomicrobiota bacterium JB022]|nr:hypothetical protein [Verrucomicrobiota bacterium JB022]
MTPAAYPALLFGALLLAGCATTSTGGDNRPVYTQGSALPAMEGRSPDLRPGAIPARVRYVVADDAVVNEAAQRLRSAIENRDPSVVGDIVFVNPGAWSALQDHGAEKSEGLAVMEIRDPGNPSAKGREGVLVQGAEQAQAIAEAFFNTATAGGNFAITAFSTQQMTRWWPYTSFDIEEPTFVVTTEDGRYELVVGFSSKGQIVVLDELNALPKER